MASKAELERIWEWSGEIIEELEELRATIARLCGDVGGDDPQGYD